jgi:nucleoporin NUP42
VNHDELVDDSEDTIRNDLDIELPQYIISSYGVAKSEPNLFIGYDTSPEELRWKSVQALRDNNPAEYV